MFVCARVSCRFASAQFLAQKFDIVFDKYNILLRSANYVTRRQSLKLLGELLLDRSNFQVMMRYIQVIVKTVGGRACGLNSAGPPCSA